MQLSASYLQAALPFMKVNVAHSAQWFGLPPCALAGCHLRPYHSFPLPCFCRRLMAYIGPDITVADVVVRPSRSIIKQSYDARERRNDSSLPFHLGRFGSTLIFGGWAVLVCRWRVVLTDRCYASVRCMAGAEQLHVLPTWLLQTQATAT